MFRVWSISARRLVLEVLPLHRAAEGLDPEHDFSVLEDPHGAAGLAHRHRHAPCAARNGSRGPVPGPQPLGDRHILGRGVDVAGRPLYRTVRSDHEGTVELGDFLQAQQALDEQRRLIERLSQQLPQSNLPTMERLWVETLGLFVQQGLNITPITDSQLDQVMQHWRNAASDSMASPGPATPTYAEASRLLVELLRDANRLTDVAEVETKISPAN